MNEIDPRVIEFARKLVTLMEEYSVSFDVQEETRDWTSMASGIDIALDLPRDREYRGANFIEIQSTYIGSEHIERALPPAQTGQEDSA